MTSFPRGLPMRRLRNDKGFSLIELVVSLALLASLASISTLLIQSFSTSYYLRQAMSHIVSQVQLARIHAIKSRTNAVVVFKPAAFSTGGRAGTFSIFEDANKNWKQDPGEKTILAESPMPPQVSLTSALFTSNGCGLGDLDTTCFGFDSQGVAARNGAAYVTGNIQLQDRKNETRTISFQVSGKSKVSMP
jgi:prepilin-type N-terminal cleavage/methylation domain-containing protein